MKITVVKVGCLFNTGNYENQRFELEAQLQEGDTLEEVADALKQQIHTLADREDLYRERSRLKREFDTLTKQTAEARAQWEQTKMFMTAQGLRTDAPDFPIPLTTALAPASERVDVVEEDDFA